MLRILIPLPPQAVSMCKGWLAEEEAEAGEAEKAKELKQEAEKESDEASRL